jgi:hypothetical protein
VRRLSRIAGKLAKPCLHGLGTHRHPGTLDVEGNLRVPPLPGKANRGRLKAPPVALDARRKTIWCAFPVERGSVRPPSTARVSVAAIAGRPQPWWRLRVTRFVVDRGPYFSCRVGRSPRPFRWSSDAQSPIRAMGARRPRAWHRTRLDHRRPNPRSPRRRGVTPAFATRDKAVLTGARDLRGVVNSVVDHGIRPVGLDLDRLWCMGAQGLRAKDEQDLIAAQGGGLDDLSAGGR